MSTAQQAAAITVTPEQRRKDLEYIYSSFEGEESRQQAIISVQSEIDRVSREAAARADSAKKEAARIQEEINAQIRRDYGVYESELTRENRIGQLSVDLRRYQNIANSPGDPNENRYVNLLQARATALRQYETVADLEQAKKEALSASSVQAPRVPGGAGADTKRAQEQGVGKQPDYTIQSTKRIEELGLEGSQVTGFIHGEGQTVGGYRGTNSKMYSSQQEAYEQGAAPKPKVNYLYTVGLSENLGIGDKAFASSPQATIRKESIKAFTDVIPSSTTKASFVSVNLFEGRPEKPKELSQVEVDKLTPEQYADYVSRIENYNAFVKQYNKEIKGTQLTQFKKDKAQLLEYIESARKAGFSYISINTPTGDKTIPINRAFHDIISTKNIIGISTVPILPKGYTVTGTLERYPENISLFPLQRTISQSKEGKITDEYGPPTKPQEPTDFLTLIGKRASEIALSPKSTELEKGLAGAAKVGIETFGGLYILETKGAKAFADLINATGQNQTKVIVGEPILPETAPGTLLSGTTAGIAAAAASGSPKSFFTTQAEAARKSYQLVQKQGVSATLGEAVGYLIPFGGSPVKIARGAFEVIPEAGLKGARFTVRATEKETGKTLSVIFKKYPEAERFATKLGESGKAATIKITASQETLKSLQFLGRPLISKVGQEYNIGGPEKASLPARITAVEKLSPSGRGLEVGTQTKYVQQFLTSKQGLEALEKADIILPRDVEAVKLGKETAEIIRKNRELFGTTTYANLKGLESLKTPEEQKVIFEKVLPKSKVPIKGHAAEIAQVRPSILEKTPRVLTGDIDRDFALMKFLGKIGLGKVSEKLSLSAAKKDVEKVEKFLTGLGEKERSFTVKGTKLYAQTEGEPAEKVLENLTHRDVSESGSPMTDFSQVFGTKYKYDIVKGKSPEGKTIKFRSLPEQTLTKLTSFMSIQGPRTEKFVGEGTPDFLKGEIQTTKKGFTVIAPESRLKDPFDLLRLDVPELAARLTEKGKIKEGDRLTGISKRYRELYPEIDFSVKEPIIEKGEFMGEEIPSLLSRSGITPSSITKRGAEAVPIIISSGGSSIDKKSFEEKFDLATERVLMQPVYRIVQASKGKNFPIAADVRFGKEQEAMAFVEPIRPGRIIITKQFPTSPKAAAKIFSHETIHGVLNKLGLFEASEAFDVIEYGHAKGDVIKKLAPSAYNRGRLGQELATDIILKGGPKIKTKEVSEIQLQRESAYTRSVYPRSIRTQSIRNARSGITASRFESRTSKISESASRTSLASPAKSNMVSSIIQSKISPVSAQKPSQITSVKPSSASGVVTRSSVSVTKSPSQSKISPVSAQKPSQITSVKPSSASGVVPASPGSPVKPSNIKPLKPLNLKLLRPTTGFVAIPGQKSEIKKPRKIKPNDFVGNVSDVDVALGFNRREITLGIKSSARLYKKDIQFAYKRGGFTKFATQTEKQLLPKKKQSILEREKPKVVKREKKRTGGFF